MNQAHGDVSKMAAQVSGHDSGLYISDEKVRSIKVDDTPNGRSPRKNWFSSLCVMI